MKRGDAEVVAVGDRGEGDAELARALDRGVDGERTGGEGEPAARVDQHRAAARPDDFRYRGPVGAAVGEMGRVLRHPRDTVRGEPAGVGVDQRPRRRRGHLRSGPGARQRAGGELLEFGERDDGHGLASGLAGATTAGSGPRLGDRDGRRAAHRWLAATDYVPAVVDAAGVALRCQGSSSRSTLPPESTMPTRRPRTASAPSSRQASGTADDASMTIFIRSQVSRIARTMPSSRAGADRLDVRPDRGQRARRERRAQAVGDGRRRRQRLDPAAREAPCGVVGMRGLGTEDADARRQRAGDDRRPRQQAAAAARRDDDVEVGDLGEKLERRRRLPGDHVEVVERMDQRGAAFALNLRARAFAGSDVGRAEADRGALAGDVGDLHPWRVLGHHHPRGNAAPARRIRKRRSVVARRVGHDAASSDVGRQRKDGVGRARAP